MRLRLATFTDAEAIAHIRIEAWRAAYGDFMPSSYLGSLDPTPTIESLKAKLSTQDSGLSVTVAEHAQYVVGFSMLGSPRYEAGASTIELWALNVQPSSWGLGAGRALTLNCIEEARSQGKSVIELWCICGNLPAQQTYESCGFRLTGRERTTTGLTGHPLHERIFAKVL
jgi:ribosomal protein S18 acetylase RimI-like enzyme